jgi:hypothetical protein
MNFGFKLVITIIKRERERERERERVSERKGGLA